MGMTEDIDWGEQPFLREVNLIMDSEELRLYWTTKEGEKIFIEDMETNHIENIIKAGLDERMNVGEQTEDRLLLELSIRRGR